MKKILLTITILFSVCSLCCAESQTETLYPLKIRGKYGYINAQGILIIDAVYDKAERFSDGLGLVKEGDKTGFVNALGEIVFYCEYDSVRSFSDGLAAIRVNGQWGFIDTTGSVVISPKYLLVDDFSEGVAAICNARDDWIYINKQGENVFPNKTFEAAKKKSEGYMVVSKQVYEDYYEIRERNGIKRRSLVSGDRGGVMDSQGNMVIPFEHAYHSSEVRDGIFRYSIIEETTGRSLRGFLNMQNEVVIPPRFYLTGDFYKGIVPVSSDGEKYGVIDKTGKYIIPEEYDTIFTFSSDMGGFEQDGKFGFFDMSGNIAIPAQFDFGQFFYGDLAFIRKDGIDGYVTKTGTIYLSTMY